MLQSRADRESPLLHVNILHLFTLRGGGGGAGDGVLKNIRGK